MISATAWNNGRNHRSGAGYGLTISAFDRDQFFRRQWGSVRLRIGNGDPFSVNIDKPSFWEGSCRHLISAEIGRWMLANRLAPWPRYHPPNFSLIPGGEPSAFEIRTLAASA